MKKSSLGRRSLMAGHLPRRTTVPDDTYFVETPSCSQRNTFIPRTGERTPRQTTMSTDSRKSSICSGKMQKDTRPLAEKEWQQCTTRNIMMYLTNDFNGRDVVGNVKNLRNMSTGLFIDIFNVLMSKLDRKVVEMNKVNYISQIPIVMKTLDYPGKCDKPFLQTVNAPHNYGFVLGVFDYLLTLVKAKDVFCAHMADVNNLFLPSHDIEEDADFMDPKVMYEMARAWYADISVGELAKNQDAYDAEILEKCGLSESIMEEVKQKKEELMQKSKLVEQDKACLQALIQKEADLNTQIQEKQNAISEAEAKIEDFKQKTWQAERDYDDCNNDLITFEMQKNQLEEEMKRNIKAKDEIARKDEDRKTQGDLNKAIVVEESNINTFQDIAHSVDSNIVCLEDEVQSLIMKYNSIALKAAAECVDKDFGIGMLTIPFSSEVSEEQLSAAFTAAENVLTHMTESVNQLDQSIQSYEFKHQELQTEYNQLKEQIQQKVTELNNLKTQEESDAENFKTVQEHYCDVLKEKQNAIKELKEEVELLKRKNSIAKNCVNSLEAKIKAGEQKLECIRTVNREKERVMHKLLKEQEMKLREKMKPEYYLEKALNED